MSLKCPSCEREIQKNWRFCRFCGTRLDLAQNEEFETTPPSSIHGNDAILEESPVASAEKEPVQPEPHKIDRETYKRIILTRDKRRRLALEKKELVSQVDALLEQVRAGLLTKESVMPEIQKIKQRKEEIERQEKEIGELPEELPIEKILDEEGRIRDKLRKLDMLKKDDSVSKETIAETKRELQAELDTIRMQKHLEQAELKKWLADLKQEISEKRKELEKLYVNLQLGELSKEKYEELKKQFTKDLEGLADLIRYLEGLLKR